MFKGESLQTSGFLNSSTCNIRPLLFVQVSNMLVSAEILKTNFHLGAGFDLVASLKLVSVI